VSPGSVPRVTAVVTTFRPDFNYLRQAIESALAQSMAVQVLVSDSGMDPAVREFVTGFGPAVRYRDNGRVVGPAENHRETIAEVRTPYFALLGHDDAWEPGFLDTLVPALDANPKCILAFSDHWFIDAAGRVDDALTDKMSRHWGRAGRPEGTVDDVLPLLIQQAVPVAMAAVIRTADAQRHPIPDLAGPAYDIWLHAALAGEGRPYWYSRRRLTRWRFHAAAGTNAGNPDWYRGAATTWDSVVSDPRFATVQSAARRRAADAWLKLAKSLARRDAPLDEVRNAANNSARHVPGLQARITALSPRVMRWLLGLRDLAKRS
jgi:glycosyltransferase involved in cell wall biosynthesis